MTTHTAHPEQIKARRARRRPADARAATLPDRTRVWETGLARCALSSYALLWAATVLFALIAIPLAGPLRELFGLRDGLAAPGTASMVALIAANNAREAAVPFLFAALRTRDRRWLILLGDVVVAGCLGANTALGGLALGTYGIRLLPYLPQWPLEWAGLALALTGWRRVRSGRQDPCELALLAIATAILLCLAALIETYAVPQS
jgi:hypothetical protein